MTHVLLRRVTNVFDEYVYRNAQTLDSVTVFVPGGIQRRRRLGIVCKISRVMTEEHRDTAYDGMSKQNPVIRYA